MEKISQMLSDFVNQFVASEAPKKIILILLIIMAILIISNIKTPPNGQEINPIFYRPLW